VDTRRKRSGKISESESKSFYVSTLTCADWSVTL
jgi:hypothetical protein